jgi:hypothetical protein
MDNEIKKTVYAFQLIRIFHMHFCYFSDIISKDVHLLWIQIYYMTTSYGFSGTTDTQPFGPGLNLGMKTLRRRKNIWHTDTLLTVKGWLEVVAAVVELAVITVDFWQRFKSQYYYI